MKIDSSLTADAALIVMNGRLDASWSPMVAAALEEAIRSGRSRIELDLANVDFISPLRIATISITLPEQSSGKFIVSCSIGSQRTPSISLKITCG